MKNLWVEKYRPSTVEEYVFQDENQKKQVQEWIKAEEIPHLLFSGPPGTGKTTLAKVLINELDLEQFDVLTVNASRERGIDHLRDKLTGFAQTIPFGKFKVILLDEADALTIPTQDALRNLMEQYHENCRFILTCNYPHKIVPAIHDRCQSFKIEKADMADFAVRVAEVLLAEDIDFDVDLLDVYVKAAYPSLRKALNLVQQNTLYGVLQEQVMGSDSGMDAKVNAVKAFKAGNNREGRTILSKNIRPDQMDDIFRWSYDNLELWGETDEQQDAAILIIRDAIVNNLTIADPEINLSAMLVELSNI